jgi:HlyD family secretion protein
MPPTPPHEIMDQPSTRSNVSESNPLAQVGMDRKIKKKNWPPKKIAVVVAAAAFVIFVLYSFVLRDTSSRLNVETDRITISTVARGPFQEFIPVNGTVLPLETFFLDAVEGGRVEKLYVDAGAFVKMGQPILRLTNSQFQLDVMYREAMAYEQINNAENRRLAIEQNSISIRSQLADAENSIRQTTISFTRDSALAEKNLIAPEEFERTRNDYSYWQKKLALARDNYYQDSLLRVSQLKQIESSIGRLSANVEMLKQSIENLTVRAPIDGQLTALNAEIGESKSPGQRLGQVDALENFKVRADIDEFYISRINIGQTGEFDLNDTTYELIIKKVYPEVNNGRFQVDLYFVGQAPKGIRRGQTLQIRLELGDLSEALLLPRGGFYQKTGGQWVYVLDASGDFAVKRAIKLGRQNPQMFEVLDGLAPGDRVITSSYDNFGDIDKLVLKR